MPMREGEAVARYVRSCWARLERPHFIVEIYRLEGPAEPMWIVNYMHELGGCFSDASLVVAQKENGFSICEEKYAYRDGQAVVRRRQELRQMWGE